MTTAAWANNSIFVPPPSKYDHTPTLPVERHYVDTEKLCPARAGMKVLACSVPLNGKCYMLLTLHWHELPLNVQRLTLRHENARCNGYKG